jgi:hypothetical protein
MIELTTKDLFQRVFSQIQTSRERFLTLSFPSLQRVSMTVLKQVMILLTSLKETH